MYPKQIKSNSELVVGNYYYCLNKKHGTYSIEKCDISSEVKQVGNIWADDDNNQALDKWWLFEVEALNTGSIYLCSKHFGNGFVSDCVRCKPFS